MVSAAYADGKGVPRGGWLSATDSCPKGGIMKFFLKNYVFKEIVSTNMQEQATGRLG